MVEVSLQVPAPADRVFAVLSDGWSYASWVVGAAHIREVDAGWPEPGTRIHHSIGTWPALVSDVTSVRSCEPGRSLELEAGMWPFGAARIRFDLAEENGGTLVRMREEVVKGPLSVLPSAAQALFLGPRNKETLHRLADLAAHRESRN
ncbi:SRPBCC family protein [Saccharothrix variisporea]|uniref:Polyketide cyclase/dehydrase/lipid transport protein n=1 Tax=Saccharothrix variisporea TaxID=543527 RepID=A0A495X6U2_9PSEU|nr:SRPBCC family protein [Saccharothrix variisporea]RKT68855.1 polyketide cyclase/dehydrase/lipid transport protein [Saccharothrix variisporea]